MKNNMNRKLVEFGAGLDDILRRIEKLENAPRPAWARTHEPTRAASFDSQAAIDAIVADPALAARALEKIIQARKGNLP